MQIISFTIGILWIILIIYWILSAVKSKRNFHKYNWRLEIMVRLAIAFGIILFLRVPELRQLAINMRADSFYSSLPSSITGLIIFLLGFAIAIWARVSLGKNWGMPMTIKEKPQLVTSGPYAYIRHPIYTGMLVAMLGTAIAVNGYWFIPLVIVTIYFIYSSRVEEKNMEKLFPKDYEKYRKRTSAIIPFIY